MRLAEELMGAGRGNVTSVLRYVLSCIEINSHMSTWQLDALSLLALALCKHSPNQKSGGCIPVAS